MAAERAHEPTFSPEPEPSSSFEPGRDILQSIEQRAYERQLTDKEREMLNSFVGFSRQTFDIDPRDNIPRHSQAIALAARGFLADTIQRRIALLKQAPEAQHTVVRVYVIPKDPVEREIKAHYQTFGYNRRVKPEEFRLKEERLLADKKRPIYAMSYEEQNQDDEAAEQPRKQVPRAAYFQELALGMQLEKLLRAHGYIVAADSTEVLLAAYGAWFPRQRANAIARYGIVRMSGRDAHNVYRINEEDIPEELRAEKPRYPHHD